MVVVEEGTRLEEVTRLEEGTKLEVGQGTVVKGKHLMQGQGREVVQMELVVVQMERVVLRIEWEENPRKE